MSVVAGHAVLVRSSSVIDILLQTYRVPPKGNLEFRETKLLLVSRCEHGIQERDESMLMNVVAQFVSACMSGILLTLSPVVKGTCRAFISRWIL
jgi:hypothetical protein